MTLDEVPPPNNKVTGMKPEVSKEEKLDLENCTVSTAMKRVQL